MKSVLRGLALIWLVAIGGVPAQTQVVQNPDNHHYYEAVWCPHGISWSAANRAARASGGHLATITSVEENTLVFSLVDKPEFWFDLATDFSSGPWLGGVRDEEKPNSATSFRWVTGEPFIYTNWGLKQPDNFHNEESKIHFFSQGKGHREPIWNDTSDHLKMKGFVIEYGNVLPPNKTLDDTAPIHSQIVYNPVNHHYYEAVSCLNGITWTTANHAAQASGGYLATITSDSENEFIFSLVDRADFWHNAGNGTFCNPWLGGIRKEGKPNIARGFEWVTEEPFIYMDWGQGEPNNVDGIENRIQFLILTANRDVPTWNDANRDFKSSGYIIEYNVAPRSRDLSRTLRRIPMPTTSGILKRAQARLDLGKTYKQLGLRDEARTLLGQVLEAAGGESGIGLAAFIEMQGL